MNFLIVEVCILRPAFSSSSTWIEEEEDGVGDGAGWRGFLGGILALEEEAVVADDVDAADDEEEEGLQLILEYLVLEYLIRIFNLFLLECDLSV